MGVWVKVFGCVLSVWVIVATVTTAQADDSRVQDEILSLIGNDGTIAVGGEELASRRLREFYDNREYEPAWSKDGLLTDNANQLMGRIERAGEDGLVPEHYQHRLMRTHSDLRSDRELAQLDVVLSDAFMQLYSDLRTGRFRPRIEGVEPAAGSARRLSQTLETALATESVGPALQSAAPDHPQYGRLREALKRYRAMAQDSRWPAVPAGPVLKPGDDAQSAERLRALCKRLQAEQVEARDCTTATTFDEAFAADVRAFQRRYGLEEDGILGPQTRTALNRSPEDLVATIALNMERWRWLDRGLEDRYLLVNIAGFYMRAYEDDEPALTMRVIVGKDYTETPLFRSEMTHMIVNPFWHVPPGIIKRSLLPKLRKDPQLIVDKGIKVFPVGDRGGQSIDPHSIDWTAFKNGRVPYLFRQDPGPRNALGRIKFMMPNDHFVYLHDTPRDELFEEDIRLFSSGCVRLEKPFELARYLAANDPAIAPVDIDALRESDKARRLNLSEPVPVYLAYFTAWADTGGTVEFNMDVYGRDARLKQAFKNVARVSPD